MKLSKTNIVLIVVLSVIVAAGVAVAVIMFCGRTNEDREAVPVEEPDVETRFGFPVDDWKITSDTVRQGDYLGTILNRYGVPMSQVDKIARISDTIDYTRIAVGRPYSIFSSPDDTAVNAKIFVYENSPLMFTVFDFRDSVDVFRKYHDVDTVVCTASGRISSSLWNVLDAKGYDWDLAVGMSQVWAWTVDFYALQKDDWFKVIFEEYRVDGETVRIGKVQAGVFYHNGKEMWAIPFVRDSIVEFFDTCGMSTRKTFMKAPLKFTRISSRYTNSRMHPIHHVPKAHLAVDFSAPMGTPIYAASDGRITIRQYGNGSGNYVKIRHNAVYETVYMHLSKFGMYNVGDYVHQGDVIGYVGSTGWSTGPHLHYEVHENGKKINPLNFDPPPAEPVDSANMERFNREKRPWIEKIDKIVLE
ncbi:MAG: peptidoglycan DD-metalloendopeptidase family protein [Bacteroidales bacterium]|nr:peptidoglycan DD-metalloendopeptidase family protein [Bacteroidales bacterium]